jgi:hypothetical protein
LKGYIGLWENLVGVLYFRGFFAFLCYNFLKSPPPVCIYGNNCKNRQR